MTLPHYRQARTSGFFPFPSWCGPYMLVLNLSAFACGGASHQVFRRRGSRRAARSARAARQHSLRWNASCFLRLRKPSLLAVSAKTLEMSWRGTNFGRSSQPLSSRPVTGAPPYRQDHCDVNSDPRRCVAVISAIIAFGRMRTWMDSNHIKRLHAAAQVNRLFRPSQESGVRVSGDLNLTI